MVSSPYRKILNNINDFSFSDPYGYLCDKMINKIKPWKQKLENEQEIDPSEWSLVWSNVHHFSIVYKVQVVCGNYYKGITCVQKSFFKALGICKHCNRDQNERTHIFLTCNIINSVYGVFLPL